MSPLALTLSGGLWIVLGVFAVGFAALIFSYFTNRGTEYASTLGGIAAEMHRARPGSETSAKIRRWTLEAGTEGTLRADVATWLHQSLGRR
jgi:hypothetical protein